MPYASRRTGNKMISQFGIEHSEDGDERKKFGGGWHD